MTERRIRRLPQCEHCRNNAHSSYLLCAIHPYGVAEDLKRCPDYQLDPNYLEGDDWWEPQEFGIYSGEVIVSPVDRLTKAQQFELLLWHPLFTGLCPQCRHSLAAESDRVHWDCQECGWMDDTA